MRRLSAVAVAPLLIRANDVSNKYTYIVFVRFWGVPGGYNQVHAKIVWEQDERIWKGKATLFFNDASSSRNGGEQGTSEMHNHADDSHYVDDVSTLVERSVSANLKKFLAMLGRDLALDTHPFLHHLRSGGQYTIRRPLHHRMDERPKEFKVYEMLRRRCKNSTRGESLSPTYLEELLLKERTHSRDVDSESRELRWRSDFRRTGRIHLGRVG